METTIRIGGVPEHFNIPWYQVIAENKFLKNNIHLHWTDYPGGTGAMMQDIRTGELDIAIALTEGVVNEIINNESCFILQHYVVSPLIWGIHVSEKSPIKKLEELEDKRFAISRMGSGSHLMAFVNALQKSWDVKKLTLVPVGNLDGARNALAIDEADGFMWEKFMTKPIVDAGEFRRVGECPTPWPCFTMVGSKRFLESSPIVLDELLATINKASENFMNDEEAPVQVANTFRLELEDAKNWFSQTKWATNNEVSATTIQEIIEILFTVGSIGTKPAPEKLCSKYCKLI